MTEDEYIKNLRKKYKFIKMRTNRIPEGMEQTETPWYEHNGSNFDKDLCDNSFWRGDKRRKPEEVLDDDFTDFPDDAA